VPVAALALTVAASAAVIGIAYLSPGSVFAFLTTSIGAIIVIDYVIIAATHIRLRHRLERDGHPPPTLAMWMFPWLSYATLIALLAILVSMAFLDDLRKQLLYSLASVAAIAATGIVRQRLHGEARQPHSAPRADPSHPASVIAGADGGSRSRAPSTP
jgi:GABA permease